MNECPWCGGTTEWYTVEPPDQIAPEEILVCNECGELLRTVLVDDDENERSPD